MGREIRRVPQGWQHPLRDEKPWPSSGFPEGERFQPQMEADKPYLVMLREYTEAAESWERGEHRDCRDEAGDLRAYPYHEWEGGPPEPRGYMPYWPDAERTHLQMYEDTSEGTPISPVFATPEEVARWCADNGASIFGNDTASYETWLRIAGGGAAIGLMIAVPAGTMEHLVVDAPKKAGG